MNETDLFKYSNQLENHTLHHTYVEVCENKQTQNHTQRQRPTIYHFSQDIPEPYT